MLPVGLTWRSARRALVTKTRSLALRRMARTFSSAKSPGSGTSSSGFTTQTRANTAGGSGVEKNCTLPSSWRRWNRLSTFASEYFLISSAR